jgi:hypothetical protein
LVGIVRSRTKATELVKLELGLSKLNTQKQNTKIANKLQNKAIYIAIIIIKTGLENRDYGRRGFAALAMRYPSNCKSWH